MAKSKITITGEPKKPPKVNEDGTIDLIFKTEMSEAVPKGLTSLGETNYIVHVGKKTWSKVEDQVRENSFYIISGEPKARITTKGVPFTEVICFDIAIKEAEKPKEKAVELAKEIINEKPKEVKPPEVKKPVKQEPKPKEERPKKKYDRGQYVPSDWYKPEEVINIDTRDLILVEKTHLRLQRLDMNGVLYKLNSQEVNFVVAVRPIENGKYALVMGIRGYIIAKLLNKETIRAVIRDCEYSELIAGYEKQLEAENNKA
jgi:hypothetical protein